MSIRPLRWREKLLHESVFQRESRHKYAAQGGTAGSTWTPGERLASPPTRTLLESFSLCDSERIKVLSVSRMDDLSATLKWYTARCGTFGTELQ
ncbi:MAG TPA: hypothetical protein VE604_05645 [Candidatus Polarisedimenticolia bacterium]|nr:hypothetical protein [Candidatus Polarisedimenticolia bacterium]